MHNIIEHLLERQSAKTLCGSAGINELHYQNGRHWLYSGGDAIQSVFDENNPQIPVLDYQQHMLLALVLLNHSPKSVLNLGCGIGSFERAFASCNQLPEKWQAIEHDESLIELMAKHLPLPAGFAVTAADAQQWLTTTSSRFDLILCDLFVGQNHASCLDNPSFFSLLRDSLSADGALAVNLAPTSQTHMTDILLKAKAYFDGGFIGKIPPFGNIVLCLSVQKQPDFSVLLTRAQQLDQSWPLSAYHKLSQMHRL